MEPRNDRAVALRGRGTYKVCRLAWGAEWSGTCELNVVLACFDRWHCAAMTHGFEEAPLVPLRVPLPMALD